jgi:hypothetical protein
MASSSCVMASLHNEYVGEGDSNRADLLRLLTGLTTCLAAFRGNGPLARRIKAEAPADYQPTNARKSTGKYLDTLLDGQVGC